MGELVAQWMEDAACRGVDPELFFPERGGNGSQSRDAIAVCNVCPVREECLQYAMRNGERSGVWGGMTERQRRTFRKGDKYRREQAPAACGTESGYNRHRRTGIPACAACLEANRKAKAERRLRVVV